MNILAQIFGMLKQLENGDTLLRHLSVRRNELDIWALRYLVTARRKKLDYDSTIFIYIYIYTLKRKDFLECVTCWNKPVNRTVSISRYNQRY